MLTVFDDTYAAFVGALQTIATAVQAQEKVDAEYGAINAKYRVLEQEIPELAEKEADEWLRASDDFASNKEQSRPGLVADLKERRLRALNDARNREFDHADKRLQPFTGLLRALDICGRDWRVSSEALQVAGEALSQLRGAEETSLPEDAQEAVSRGYRASTRDAAKAAIAQMKRDMDADQKRAEDAAKLRERDALQAEYNRLKAAVDANVPPEKRLAQLEKELRAMGGAA